ncbi:MAG: ATP-binding protein [Acidimicrobiales bacterium]
MTSTGLDGAGVGLDLPARSELVGLVRLVVSSLASTRRDLADDRVDDLKLAVSEACTNAIESYDEGAASPRVVVEWAEAGDRLEVVVRDQGRGADPDQVVGRPADGVGYRPDSDQGLGVALIRALMDEVDFVVGDGPGTTVRMTLYCGRAELAEA